MKVSAGCLAVREHEDGEQVLLVKVYGKWQISKGMLEGDETLEQTAKREFEEETGLEVELGEYVGHITYQRRPKTVHCFLATMTGGEVDEEGRACNIEWEIHEARFMSWEKARELIIPSQAQLIDMAIEKRGQDEWAEWYKRSARARQQWMRDNPY